ncbi:uncharacterized oxidoreductase [Paenibacillus sp. UNCCL117]|uniref:SDR family oxidoreductase n=1 Tax=unclassified Paenibacillus TaxID=185978 RepID=UPI0008837929|nr:MULTISPECIES: SDR family oxidoreductase [unclassified Paenibacillus]SDC91634.1 uncharacterized oxidoreductase [Paenibacillus sp. cl123]SFW29127.1 uncharacterized oxidoreductase [Paenibacillus sp. UNCCL117]
MKLTDHTVLITGGSSGIGLALVKAFLDRKNQVIIVGRNEQKLARAKALHPGITTYACDIGEPEQLNKLVREISSHHPGLNLLINNAGTQQLHSFIDTAPSDAVHREIEQEIAINLTSPIVLISSLLPLLRSQKQAAIVNVTSGLGLVPKQSAPVYCATKAGLHLFTKALRYQLEHTSIKVYELIPPVVDTDMTRGRGSGKISPEQVATEFMAYLERDRYEMPIGKVKLLTALNRWLPFFAERILKNS